ncbi:NAD(P)H azoreductase-like [Corticium candelabrum]|uniref:NAD(P)H azoreductase-like n=1 Tax=Corticium candelabrum TaxID=121492 RepID=UPI002E25EB58|nr:NAD(P)H azoreductase-like [Corticium candelabrum]
MSKPVVLVLGTNGYVGKATVKSLSETYADKVVVKAASRDPAKLGELRDLKGVELVALDMSAPDAASHIKATGASTVYIVTPGVENRAAITSNAANASKEANVRHLVLVSTFMADTKDTVLGSQFTEIESHVKKLGLPYTLLRLPVFIDNFWADAETIKKQSTKYGAVNPDAAFTPIAVSDIGKASAAVLANPGLYVNKTIKLATKACTYNDVVKAFSESLGREIKYVQVPYEVVAKGALDMGFPEWQANALIEMNKLINAGSPVTNDPEGVIQFKSITGSDPIPVQQWVAAVAGGFK